MLQHGENGMLIVLFRVTRQLNSEPTALDLAVPQETLINKSLIYCVSQLLE